MFPRAGHDALGDGVDLGVHHELLVLGQLHEDDTEVCASQIKGEEFTMFTPVGKLTDVSWKALDTGIGMSFGLK